MKWFKHSCTARDDQKLSKLMDELGLEGYGCYMIILEVVGHEMGSTNECFAEFSLKKWGNFCQLSPKRFRKFAEVMAKLSLFDADFSEKNAKINIPNLLKYRDNHTRNLQVTNKKVTVEKEKEKEKEKELDKDNINTKVSSKPKKEKVDYSKDFEFFWKQTVFPKRPQDTKGDMKKKYATCRSSGLTQENMLFACQIFEETNRGNEFAIGMRKFLNPDTVKEYLTEDVTLKDQKAQGAQKLRELEARLEQERIEEYGDLNGTSFPGLPQ